MIHLVRAVKDISLKFTPLEFETTINIATAIATIKLKFTPLEFETVW